MADTQVVITEPSVADLRAMLAPAAETPAKTETSEPAAEPATEESHEAATETAETKPEPATTEDEPLPEGVQKRIAKEAEKAARIQAEIDRAVSARKAKEAELAKLSEAAQGAEPVKSPNAATDKPKRPEFGESGHESETYQQFEARQEQYFEARDAWNRKEALREFEARQQQNEAQKSAKQRWDEAVKKHGPEFPALMDTAVQLAPEGLQTAISRLDNWSDVAVHLAKNPAQLKELAATFAQNEIKAIATLGRIEAAITSKQEPKPATKPLPEPPARVGGSASASGQTTQEALETGSMSTFKARVAKMRGR